MERRDKQIIGRPADRNNPGNKSRALCEPLSACVSAFSLVLLLLCVHLNMRISISKRTECTSAGIWAICLFTTATGKKLSDLGKPDTLIFCYLTPQLENRLTQMQTHLCIHCIVIFLSYFPKYYWIKSRQKP